MRLGLKEVLVSFCLICAPVIAAAQSTPQRTLLALSKHERTLAMVDPAPEHRKRILLLPLFQNRSALERMAQRA
jgi:hypothetical protein